MEIWLKSMAESAGLLLEMIVVIVVLLGGLRAIVQMVAKLITRRMSIAMARIIWIDFATAILLALEFALGADIVQTAVAPTWDDIGQLAAIAAIRTGLNFFLGRDVEEFRITRTEAARQEAEASRRGGSA